MKYRIVYNGVGVLPYRVDVVERIPIPDHVPTTIAKEHWVTVAREETFKTAIAAVKIHSGLNEIVVAEINT